MQILNPIIDVLRAILNFLNSFLSSYGLSIVILSILIRIVLLPLTIKQTKSMKAMQELQPKLKELQEKYKDDKERLSKEMMSFYSDNKVNPLSGCLPLLLQLPIMFALFRMINDPKLAVLLAKEGFLWISNLAKPDIALVIAMVGTTYAQQAMITKDPQQKNMMLPMALLMGFIGFRLPAGVLLYWVTTNAFTMGQQYLQTRDTVAVPGQQPLAVKSGKPKIDKSKKK
jgi:YidC/Oxa1 family membrane protein insertase